MFPEYKLGIFMEVFFRNLFEIPLAKVSIETFDEYIDLIIFTG